MIPLQLGTEEQFARLREFLISSGYTEPEVCRQFGIDALAAYELNKDRSQIHEDTPTIPGLLSRWFVDGRYVERDTAEALIDGEVIQCMADLGLIRANEADEKLLFATVGLYPTFGTYIVSDRWNTPDRGPIGILQDVVYPAIISNAQRFLTYMPARPCEALLDIGSGTGVAALSAAQRYARHAWAADITERSTVFAEFNRRLNGISNATCVQGDLYEPVKDLTFDRIVAHPPYVPVLRPKFVYHDGGETGEHLMQRIVAGLPQYLRPGGLFFMLTTGQDRKDAPLQHRIREWLGPQENEFDVALVSVDVTDPNDFAAKLAIKSRTSEEDMLQFKAMFEQWKVTALVYGPILIQRRTDERPVFTVRRSRGDNPNHAKLEWLVDWETTVVTPGGLQSLLDNRVLTNPKAELMVRHKPGVGGWEVVEHVLRTTVPFAMEARTDAWGPYLLAYCDGTKTLRQHFDLMKSQEIFPPEATEQEFVRAVSVLVSGGFLKLEEW